MIYWSHCHLPKFCIACSERSTKKCCKQFLSLGMFKNFGIHIKIVKWLWHNKRHQMWDSALSSCCNFLLSTVSLIRYVIICERKYLKILQSVKIICFFSPVWLDLFSLLSLRLFYVVISTAFIGFDPKIMLWINLGVSSWKFRNFVTEQGIVISGLLFVTSFRSSWHKIPTYHMSPSFLEPYDR